MITPCRDIQDILLTSYLDGASTDKETALVNDHVNSCSACRAVLASSRRTQNILEALPAMAPRPDLWTDIRTAIETEAARSARFSWQGWLNLIPGTPQRVAWAGTALVLILTVTTPPLLLGRKAVAPLPDESTALISMINDREHTIFNDDIDLGTNAEYLLTNKGETI